MYILDNPAYISVELNSMKCPWSFTRKSFYGREKYCTDALMQKCAIYRWLRHTRHINTSLNPVGTGAYVI